MSVAVILQKSHPPTNICSFSSQLQHISVPFICILVQTFIVIGAFKSSADILYTGENPGMKVVSGFKTV